MGDQVFEFVERAAGDARRVQFRHRRRARPASQRLGDPRIERRSVGDARAVGDKPRIDRHRRIAQDLGAQPRPFTLVLNRQDHLFAVGAGERAVGRDGGVFEADALRRLAAVTGLQIGHVHPVGERVKQRNFERAAPPRALARIKRAQDRAIGGLTRRDVANRDADARALVGRAVDRQQAALALDQQVVSLVVAVRPLLAIA